MVLQKKGLGFHCRWETVGKTRIRKETLCKYMTSYGTQTQSSMPKKMQFSDSRWSSCHSRILSKSLADNSISGLLFLK